MSAMNNQENAKAGKILRLLRQGGNPVKRFLKHSKLRYGGFAILLTAVVIAVVILLNVAVGAIEANWNLRIDLTNMRVTSFDEQTYQIVGDLTQPVHIYAIYNSGDSSAGKIQMEEVLRKYGSISGNVHIAFVDPVADPMLVNKLAGEGGVSTGMLFVTNEDQSRVRPIKPSEYNTYTTNPLTGGQIPVFAAERRITSAVVYVTSEYTPMIRVLAGHNEVPLNGYSILQQFIASGNNIFEMTELNLITGIGDLRKGDVLLINEPTRDLNDDEYNTIRAWLADGGRLFVSIDYQVDLNVLVNLQKLLDYYQLGFGEGYIVESVNQANNWTMNNPGILNPNKDAEHPATSDLAGIPLIMPFVRPVRPVTMPESGITYTELLYTSDSAIVSTGDEQAGGMGKQIAALSAQKHSSEPEDEIRIALVGTPYATVDSQIMYSSYNAAFVLNLMDWLFNRVDKVNILSKFEPMPNLRFPDANTVWTIGAIVVIIIPLLVAAAGVTVWIRRRRL